MTPSDSAKSASAPIRVLIADDQPLVRAGLSALLGAEADLVVVGQASDGREVLAMARELRPDVACLDIRMTHADGISVTRQLAGPDVPDPIPVLILTTFFLDDHVFGALEAGASGFLLKDAEPDVICDAVRHVLEVVRASAFALSQTIVMVTQDAQVTAAADRTVFLSGGRIVGSTISSEAGHIASLLLETAR